MYGRCGIRCPELEPGEDIRAGASSSSPERRAETPNGRDYADALDDLVKASHRLFDVVANSFGTRVAQSYAYHYPGPDRAHRLHRDQPRPSRVAEGAPAGSKGAGGHHPDGNRHACIFRDKYPRDDDRILKGS